MASKTQRTGSNSANPVTQLEETLAVLEQRLAKARARDLAEARRHLAASEKSALRAEAALEKATRRQETDAARFDQQRSTANRERARNSKQATAAARKVLRQAQRDATDAARQLKLLEQQAVRWDKAQSKQSRPAASAAPKQSKSGTRQAVASTRRTATGNSQAAAARQKSANTSDKAAATGKRVPSAQKTPAKRESAAANQTTVATKATATGKQRVKPAPTKQKKGARTEGATNPTGGASTAIGRGVVTQFAAAVTAARKSEADGQVTAAPLPARRPTTRKPVSENAPAASLTAAEVPMPTPAAAVEGLDEARALEAPAANIAAAFPALDASSAMEPGEQLAAVTEEETVPSPAPATAPIRPVPSDTHAGTDEQETPVRRMTERASTSGSAGKPQGETREAAGHSQGSVSATGHPVRSLFDPVDD